MRLVSAEFRPEEGLVVSPTFVGWEDVSLAADRRRPNARSGQSTTSKIRPYEGRGKWGEWDE
jgi:hypothetical protein